ncbi:hypothetical protein [Streptomyces sp. NPDC003032]
MSQHILRHDGARPTTVKCPECGDSSLNKGTCSWVLPHPATRKKDRNIVEELHNAGHLPEIDYR